MLKQWSWKGCTTGLAIGVAGGLGLAMLLAADAPATSPSNNARYKLEPWAHAGSVPGDVGKHGAYRIDTQTGEVWVINGRDEARKLEFKP